MPFESLIILLAPAAFLVAALLGRLQDRSRPVLLEGVLSAATLIGLVVAVIGGVLAYERGTLESALLGYKDLGLSVRVDPLSAVILAMIAILAFVIVRFSRHYLDGDPRKGVFLSRLAATVAAVELLVISGNLGLLFLSWIATSLALHQLLIFYPERKPALIAARKKFIAARVGDLCIGIAFAILYLEFSTGNLGEIFAALSRSTEVAASIEIAASLIAGAAILKSAQFPTHGWLVEVMETPTPVSALLHAGILNAGPFLVIRLAYVIEASTVAPLLLIAFGGFTALFASVVLLTQPSIKVALGYSSAAHMGFMLLVTGLGVYPAVILHLVAHSFYKAHAFLSSGSAVEQHRASYVRTPARIGSPLRVLLSLLVAMGIYFGFAWMWGIELTNEPALLAVGAILILGLAQIIAPALDSSGPVLGTIQACGLALFVALAFFSLESGAYLILKSVLPDPVGVSAVTLVLASLILFGFALAVVYQIIGPTLSNKPFYQRMAIHLRNGLYANAIFDRCVGSMRIHGRSAQATN
ncbi:MAG: NADH/ubiquinone/plastoquinone (complex i) [Spirochaetaceae bacterium]|nr:NADH/ubiquinone/plastoquinone (complex i) [Spirochaetaceae bacterium]|tara:strand:- start:327110 stop:328693 length:1584 start_codon:yes stop_codon:yes gene_type:complete